MATVTPEPPAEANTPRPLAKNRERVKRNRRGRADESGARYFLVKASSADKMELGDEAATEGEAMVTAFRTAGSFAVVTEWKTNADLSHDQPVIKKEAVRNDRK